MDEYGRTSQDILMGALFWRSMGYLRISSDILFGYLFQDMSTRDILNLQRSPGISHHIPPSPRISEDILGSPMGQTLRWLPAWTVLAAPSAPVSTYLIRSRSGVGISPFPNCRSALRAGSDLHVTTGRRLRLLSLLAYRDYCACSDLPWY
jgi:hypothetical protein